MYPWVFRHFGAYAVYKHPCGHEIPGWNLAGYSYFPRVALWQGQYPFSHLYQGYGESMVLQRGGLGNEVEELQGVNGSFY